MPDEVDKFLSEKQQLETRRQELIKDVLRQKEAANKAFDEKLAKLGYNENHANKRSHHKPPAMEKSEGKLSAKGATSSTPAA